MKCPECGSEETCINKKVTIELPQRQHVFVEITYYCGNCGNYFEGE